MIALNVELDDSPHPISDNMQIHAKIIDKYESFKLKWLKLNEQDMFERLELQDVIQDKVIEMKSKYLEDKLIFDRDYWLRLIELKDKKDKDWKKIFTDTTAKAFVDNEFFDRELALIAAKATYENLMNKANNVVEYINVIKLALKKDFSI